MRTFREGELVTVATAGVNLDGIVVHVSSLVKVEVVVPDAENGPVFRSVHPKVLRERTTAAEHDDALRRVMRRSPAAGGGGRGGAGHARQGHTQASGHRTTGK